MNTRTLEAPAANPGASARKPCSRGRTLREMAPNLQTSKPPAGVNLLDKEPSSLE